MDVKLLSELAEKARENAYAPYSSFTVGAALLGKSGKIYIGTNIENSSFSATLCAERCALVKALSEGEREFEAIAIRGGKKGEESYDACMPCGICRQMLSEFCKDDFVFIVKDTEEKTYTMKELFPYPFSDFK